MEDCMVLAKVAEMKAGMHGIWLRTTNKGSILYEPLNKGLVLQHSI